MKLLSWNIRGLNGRSKQRMLKMKLQKDPPNVLFLQETKCPSVTAASILAWIWNNYLTMEIDAQGASRGLLINWNPLLITLDDALASRHSLSVSFHILGYSIRGFLMNVYGPQMEDSKNNLLNHIDWFNILHNESSLIIGGDFNMISNLEEKKGGIKTLFAEDEAFKTMINSCEMVDVQTSSGFFTWNNRRGGVHQIVKRLDHFLVSEPILTLGGILDAIVLPTARFDHWPIVLSWHSQGHSLHKPFRFEKF